jgi:hypothetical protein
LLSLLAFFSMPNTPQISQRTVPITNIHVHVYSAEYAFDLIIVLNGNRGNSSTQSSNRLHATNFHRGIQFCLHLTASNRGNSSSSRNRLRALHTRRTAHFDIMRLKRAERWHGKAVGSQKQQRQHDSHCVLQS